MGCNQTKVAVESANVRKPSRLLAREASFSVRGKYGIFVSRELGDGAKDLANDESLRDAFIQYLKSGVWMDNIAHFTNGPSVCSHEERLAREKGCVVYEYKTDSLQELRTLVDVATERASKQPAEALFTSFHRPPKEETTGRHSSGPSKHTSIESVDECYLSIDRFCGLTQDQLVSLIFGVLYPLFLRSPERSQLLKRESVGISEKATEPTEPDILLTKDTRPVTKASRRAQELFLSCAAKFDGSVLFQHLQTSAWLTDLDGAFELCRLPISIVDTNRENLPIVYVNAAFEEMYGRTREHILGKRLNLMNGPGTELVRFEQLQEALKSRLSLKIAITNYNKHGDSFLNLVALKPSGGFTFVVHCPSNRPALLEDIKMVDDVLMLMGYVVKAPAVSKIKRGQSWVPTMADVRSLSRRLSTRLSRRVLVQG